MHNVNSACRKNFAYFFMSSDDFFFKMKVFYKILSGIISVSQPVWIQIRPPGYKTFSMLNSAEHEIYPAHKC